MFIPKSVDCEIGSMTVQLTLVTIVTGTDSSEHVTVRASRPLNVTGTHGTRTLLEVGTGLAVHTLTRYRDLGRYNNEKSLELLKS